MKYNTQGPTGRDAVKAGAPISVTIEVATRGAQTPTFTLQPSDIIQNSVTLDMAGTSGSDIELGCCMASQFSFAVQESQNWNAMTFAGAYIHAIFSWDAGNGNTAQMDMFRGVIDEVRKENGAYTCIALDDMVQLDKQYDPHEVGSLWWQRTYLQAAQDIIRAVLPGATFNLYNLVNENVSIGKATDPMLDEDGNVIEVTYRQILSWLCQVMGTACVVNPRWEDSFSFVWYGTISPRNEFDLPTSDRYSSTRAISPISFTGIQVAVGDNEYLYGTDSYVLALEDNPFFTASNYTSLLTNVLPRLQLAYYPMSASLIQMPYVEPFDMVNYYDVGSNSPVRSIVTNATITANGAVNIEGKGESAEIKGYATLNPMTSAQQAVIDNINQHLAEQKEQYTSSEEALLALNNVIANALGLYVTEVPQQGGGSIYYFHDAPTLAASTYIFTMTGSGFAYTDHWEGDQTVWQGGIDANGNAVLNMLSLYQLNANYIHAGVISSNDESYKIDLTNNKQTSTGSGQIDKTKNLPFTGSYAGTLHYHVDTTFHFTQEDAEIYSGLYPSGGVSPYASSYLGANGTIVLSANFGALSALEDKFTVIRPDQSVETIAEYIAHFPADQQVVARVLVAGVQYAILREVIDDMAGIAVETTDPETGTSNYTIINMEGIKTFKTDSTEISGNNITGNNSIILHEYPVMSLGGSRFQIPNNTDMDDVFTPGEYGILSSNSAGTMSNLPAALAGRFLVSESGGINWEDASATTRYIIQTYIPYNGVGTYKRRGYSTDGGSTWTYGDWNQIEMVQLEGGTGDWRYVKYPNRTEVFVHGYQTVTEATANGSLYRSDPFTLTIPSGLTIPQGSMIVGTCNDSGAYLLNARITAANEITFRFGFNNSFTGQSYSIGYSFHIVAFT